LVLSPPGGVVGWEPSAEVPDGALVVLAPSLLDGDVISLLLGCAGTALLLAIFAVSVLRWRPRRPDRACAWCWCWSPHRGTLLPGWGAAGLAAGGPGVPVRRTIWLLWAVAVVLGIGLVVAALSLAEGGQLTKPHI
jgi:hypothetical protein